MTHSTIRFFADTLGKCTQCEVLLPDRPDPARPVPALYLLHGLSDDQSIWMRRTAIELYAGGLYLAVVMPNGDRSFYSDPIVWIRARSCTHEEASRVKKRL